MDLKLKGKVALVLAASKGLGRASAMALAGEGATVVIGARNRDNLDKTAEEIRSLTKSAVLAIPVDVSKTGEAEKFVDQAAEAFGGIDILVNNAGGPPFGRFETFDDTAWQSAFELTLLSNIRFSRLVLPHMRKKGGG